MKQITFIRVVCVIFILLQTASCFVMGGRPVMWYRLLTEQVLNIALGMLLFICIFGKEGEPK